MSNWLESLRLKGSSNQPNKVRTVELIQTITVVIAITTVVATIPELGYLPDSLPTLISSGILCISFAMTFYLARRGYTFQASLFITGFLWLATTGITFYLGSFNVIGFSGYIVTIIIASLLFDYRAGVVYFILTLLATLVGLALEVAGIGPPTPLPYSRSYIWIIQSAIFITVAILLQLAFRTLQDALNRASLNEHILKKRALQIQTAAESARDATAVRELDRLLNRAVDMIRERFGFYHAAIFLNDDHNEYTILRAATGEAGQKLLAADHKLKIGTAGIVGFVASTGKPRIALDVGKDAIHLKNPLLPQTRSEMALPLIVNQKVIGILDVQSEQQSAFDDEDVAIIQTLADQIAIAVETARLFDAAQRQLRELTVLHSVATASTQAGNEDTLIERATQIIGETFYPDNFGIILMDEKTGLLCEHPSYIEFGLVERFPFPPGVGIVGTVAKTGEPWRVADVSQEPVYVTIDARTCSEICVPLKIGDQIIGVINAESTQLDFFTAADERLLVTLAGQLSTGIQRARLDAESRRQLYELALLLEASVAVSTSLDLATVLSITAQQMTAALDVEVCLISLWNQEDDTLRNELTYSRHPEWRQEKVDAVYHLSDFPATYQVVKTRRPLVVQLDDPAADLAEKTRMEQRGFKSQLEVPLIARDRVLGILSLHSIARERSFKAEEINLCQTMVNQLATAVDNAHLFEAERQRSAELEALRQASLRLTSSLELQPVLEAILQQALKLVAANDAHIFLYDGERLSFGAALWEGNFQKEPFSQPRENGLTYSVARTGQKIVIPNMEQIERFAKQGWSGAIIGLPLRIGDQVLGVMNLAFSEPHNFLPDELRILELLADQAALALTNANLYSEARQRASELASALADLQELDRLKSEFIQNVSHELRTPLAIVLGYVEMFESGDLGQLTPEQNGPMEIVIRRLRHLNKLLDDMLTIVETEAHSKAGKPVDLAQIMFTILNDLQGPAAQAGLELKYTIDSELPLLTGIAPHLQRACENLLSNAIKFTPAGGQILVSLWAETDEVILQVQDTGIGIPDDQLERIFERFYQVDGSTTRRYGGTGLGLALVKEVVEAHGGKVSVESETGQGSIFRIALPIAKHRQ
ncbi:MAG: GAF domain-containing protein [Anaerolineales bacterium]|nr:GAF domain-containing protein [Anaerolineales bacterium]